MRELICIVCPQGCHLTVDEDNDYEVTGNRCLRGVAYGKSEAMNPTRVVTSTVCVRSGVHARCPVKTDHPIPKGDAFRAMELLNGIQLIPPVQRGDIVVANILGHQANFIATRDIPE
jgi:CxxC motif-containing protein